VCSSDLRVHDGEFGKAGVTLCGSSVVEVRAAIAGDLKFDGSGSFEADFDHVGGRAKTSRTGSGWIRIDGHRQPAA
jgi:hypothetical protein